ncbi:hypothetical protein TNCV_4702691 [Trichonephila clavipes]|nr:hypothetical protein TNCV_4702691 [Trichonephila clavipes]
MRSNAYCAYPSIRDHWALRLHEKMSRSGGQSEVRLELRFLWSTIKVIMKRGLWDDSTTNVSVQCAPSPSLHATPQTLNSNESKVPHQRLYDMELRAEYQSRCPEVDCHPQENSI